MKAFELRRGAAARALALACALATLSCPHAFALDPALDISQYAHTAWRVRDGFAPGGIFAIGQTPDGYLWLGTDFGLFRFDGVRAVPWEPPDGEPLPDDWIRVLLGASDGTLWVGTLRGLVSFKNGKRTSYPELAALSINGLVEGRDGTVWVAAQTVPLGGRMCAIVSGEASCQGQDGSLGDGVWALHEGRDGRLWAATGSGLWRWSPAPAQLFAPPSPLSGSFQVLAEGTDGAILVATRDGVSRLVDGRFEAEPSISRQVSSAGDRLLRDRDGGLWIGTDDRGLVHVHGERTDGFGRSDGLSGDSVVRIFEDREGTIWIGTVDGLDRFRELAVPALRREQGLSNAAVASVLATRDGSVWISTPAGMNRWDNGVVTVYRDRDRDPPLAVFSPTVQPSVREVIGSGMPNTAGSLFEDGRGRVWIGAPRGGVGHLDVDRFVRAPNVREGIVDSFAEDPSGDLWIAHREQGLLRLSSDVLAQVIPWAELSRAAALGREDTGLRLAADPRRGGLWLGFRFGGLAHFANGEVRAAYSGVDGLAEGQVRHVRVDDDGVVWAAAEGGLSRLDGGRIATLSGRNGLPCDTVDWTIEDDAGDVWLYMACGLVRIARAELDAWSQADEAEQVPVRVTVFGSSDGVRNEAAVGSFSPHVAKSRDGRLWLATSSGVSIVTPRNLRHNALPPPVQIEQLVADREPYDVASADGPARLPPLVRDLRIDYTALSLVAPEKMQFRYRLEGHEEIWQDAGTRRQAFYTDLPPRDYRFRVIASNNDGVWNEEGASVEFTIAPTFYQTRWFALLCIAAAASIIGLLYVLRARQIEARVAMRLDERLAERERIARDLHDTFLQSVQGLMLKFQAVMARMPDDAPSRALLEQALDRADAVLAEGRDRVYELRGAAEVQDLPQALTAVAADLTPNVPTEFRITVEGSPRALHPVVREEAFLIGAEALRNAFRHGAARHIGLEIEYSRQGLSLRVVDDGRGFDVTALSENAPGKHFGLTGLRERARKIRSQLEVSSLQGSGTQVRLRVPAVVAFATDRRSKDFAR
jgi:signal transduction histidine kinase/ligand-binding sensor domain-containing protein